MKSASVFRAISWFFFAGFLFFHNVSRAAGLAPFQFASLYEHMAEVNKEWQKQVPNSIEWPQHLTFRNDYARIQIHLLLVENILRHREVDHLSPAKRERRRKQLQVLQKYAKRGLFPLNIYHPNRQPYFVDHRGVACAVGYLLLQSGKKYLVNRIKIENNYAYIQELDYPEIAAWAEDHGFTLDELAWIQPGYPPLSRPFEPVGAGLGVAGRINALQVNGDSTLLFMAGAFTSVDGVSAANVIAWDGVQWRTIPEGPEGEVLALAFHEGVLYVAGNFLLAGEPSNIAGWDGETWESLQSGEMDGVIRTLAVFQDGLYAGGDFTQVDENPMAYLTRYDWGEERWSNEGWLYEDDTRIAVSGGLAVNGPVHCLSVTESGLLVGGRFTVTAPGVSNSNFGVLSTDHVAFWNDGNWIKGFKANDPPGAIPPVDVATEVAAQVIIGGTFEDGMMSVLDWREDAWEWAVGSFGMMGDGQFHQIAPTSEGQMIVGGFGFSPFLGTFGDGAVVFSDEFGGNGYGIFNNTVNAVAEFKDKLIFTGDFTQVNNLPVTQLAQVTPGLVNDVEDSLESPELGVFINREEALAIDYQNFPAPAEFRLFSLDGKLGIQLKIPPGSGRITKALRGFPQGMYVYTVTGKAIRVSGKVVR